MAKEIKYNDKICDKCKNVYTPISSTQKWCYNCLTKRCKQCGNEFQVKNKSKYEKSLFCSRECKGKYRSEHYITILAETVVSAFLCLNQFLNIYNLLC